MPLGLSFAPRSQDEIAARGTGGPSPSPIQEAIRILSLRLPRAFGASAPAPSALMAGAGAPSRAAALPGPTTNPILEQLLRALLGGMAPQGMARGLPGLPVPGGAMGAFGLPPGPMGPAPRSPILTPGFRFEQQPPSPGPVAPPAPATRSGLDLSPGSGRFTKAFDPLEFLEF